MVCKAPKAPRQKTSGHRRNANEVGCSRIFPSRCHAALVLNSSHENAPDEKSRSPVPAALAEKEDLALISLGQRPQELQQPRRRRLQRFSLKSTPPPCGPARCPPARRPRWQCPRCDRTEASQKIIHAAGFFWPHREKTAAPAQTGRLFHGQAGGLLPGGDRDAQFCGGETRHAFPRGWNFPFPPGKVRRVRR